MLEGSGVHVKFVDVLMCLKVILRLLFLIQLFVLCAFLFVLNLLVFEANIVS